MLQKVVASGPIDEQGVHKSQPIRLREITRYAAFRLFLMPRSLSPSSRRELDDTRNGNLPVTFCHEDRELVTASSARIRP